MHPAGIKSLNSIKKEHLTNYSYENKALELPGDFIHHFKSNPEAWNFFKAQAPSYQKNISRWIMDAKQESTRYRRLLKAIAESEAGERIF